MSRVGKVVMVAGGLLLLNGSIMCSMVLAASDANISRSYQTTINIPYGSLVSLNPVRGGYIVLANATNQQHLLGVAVPENQSLLAAVSSSNNTVQVALSGVAEALVSTLNGPITIGEQVAVSPINGIGQLAVPGEWVIGTAQSTFNNKTPNSKVVEVTNQLGKRVSISVGYINIAVAVTTDPAPQSFLGSFQRLTSNITGKPTSVSQVVLAAAISLVAIVALITLIYGTIRGSLISIGRNPLAKKVIFLSLLQVLGMTSLIVLLAGVIDYLVLS